MTEQKKIIHPDYEIVKAGVRTAFRSLRSQDIVARMDYMCCGTCALIGLARVALDQDKKGFAFYHGQDVEGLKYRGYVYVGFGGIKDWYDHQLLNKDRKQPYEFPENGLTDLEAGELVVRALKEQGQLSVSWDQDTSQRVKVSRKRVRRKR